MVEFDGIRRDLYYLDYMSANLPEGLYHTFVIYDLINDRPISLPPLPIKDIEAYREAFNLIVDNIEKVRQDSMNDHFLVLYKDFPELENEANKILDPVNGSVQYDPKSVKNGRLKQWFDAFKKQNRDDFKFL